MKWFAQKHLHGFIPQMYVQASLMLVLTGEHLLSLQDKFTSIMYSFDKSMSKCHEINDRNNLYSYILTNSEWTSRKM